MKRAFAIIVLVMLCAGSAYAQAEVAEVTRTVDVFEKGYIQVWGESADNQPRYDALRAAEVVAQRKLVEAIHGLTLAAGTSVAKGVLRSEEIRTWAEGTLRGAIPCGREYVKPDRYGRVCLRIGVHGRGGLYDTFLPLLRENKAGVPSRPAFTPPPAQVQQAAMQLPAQQPYDGLIVDVRSLSFMPAVVNRILTEKKQILFGPSKVLNQLLIERGCGGYTTDLSKAKALLSTWGSTNPMTVKGVGVDKGTDVLISHEEAMQIFASDEKSNLVAQARVVFVLR